MQKQFLKKSNGDNLFNCDKTHKPELGEEKNSKTHIVIRLKIFNIDKTQKLKLEPNLITTTNKVFW